MSQSGFHKQTYKKQMVRRGLTHYRSIFVVELCNIKIDLTLKTMQKQSKITFQLQGVPTYAAGQISVLCIGRDAEMIANMLSEKYSVREIAYLHYTEDLSLPTDIVYIPYPATFRQDNPMLSPVMENVDTEKL